MSERSGASASDHAARPFPARAPLLVGLAVALAAGVVAVVDPNRPGHYPTCPLLALTGWSCPACGGLRATHALAHLDLATAWSANPLWVVLVPVLLVAWAAWLVRAGRRRRARPVPAWALLALGVLLVLFGVLRNVPVLAPALGP